MEFRRILEIKRQKENLAVGEVNDLMDGVRHIRDGEGKQLCDEEVLDNIVSFVIGGYESTSVATMWSLYHLYKFPDVLQRFRVMKFP